MYTAQEIEAGRIFDIACQKAWENYWGAEVPAREAYLSIKDEAAEVRKEEIEKAHKECIEAAGH